MNRLLLILLFSGPFILIAQCPDWMYFSESRAIHALIADESSVWSGSYSGLMKIDKATGEQTFFNKINTPLSDAWISKIVKAGDGSIWLGTWMKGDLIHYDGTNWTIYDTANSPLPGVSITQLDIDSQGQLWLSTGHIHMGLFRFDGNDWTNYTTSNSNIPSNSYSALLCDGNTVWIAYNEGIAKFDGTNWTNYTALNSGISSDYILDLKTDSDGNLWLLSHDGLEKFDGENFMFFPSVYTDRLMTSMTIFPDNTICVGCAPGSGPGGLIGFDGFEWTHTDTTNSEIQDISISPVYADGYGTLWYGCNNLGMVGSIQFNTWTLYDASIAKLPHSYVRDIVHSRDGSTFIGNYRNNDMAQQPGDCLTHFDWNSWSPLPNYDENSLAMAVSSDGHLIVKNPSGIHVWDGTNWQLINGTPQLQTGIPVQITLEELTPDNEGGIWIDYLDWVESIWDPVHGLWWYIPHEGLAHYDGTSWITFTPTNSPLPDADIRQISVDKQGIVWIGTLGGLVCFNGSDWQVFNTGNSSIPRDYIYSFQVDSLGGIWMDDLHFGLYRFDGVNLIHYPHPTLGIYQSNSILYPDLDGSIWMTPIIIHFDGSEFTTFTDENTPLPDFGGISCISVDTYGNKWFGTQFGFLVYREGGVITSLPETASETGPAMVAPNPFNDHFDILINKPTGPVTVVLYDLLLRPLSVQELPGSSPLRVYRKGLPSGSYYYKVFSDKKIIATGKAIAR